MATSPDRQAHQAWEVLGLSPRRLMTARRDWSRNPTAGRRSDHAAIMRRIERVLIALRRAGRRAILIADADCGDGRLLIDAAHRAHALGFLVVLARGFDSSPKQIAAAAAAAETRGDPGVSFSFAARDESAPLLLDAGGDDRADLMLAGARTSAADIAEVIDRDGILIRHR